MLLSKLDVVNACLSTMGELPLTELDEDHDMIASALRILTVESARVQTTGWWFNREVIRLSPDPVTGFIYVPNDCISLDALCPQPEITIRARRIYKTHAGRAADPYVFDTPLDLHYIRNVPFEDLPGTAQLLIQARTVLRFQADNDGDPNKRQALTVDMQDAYIQFNTEHITNVQANLVNTPSMVYKMRNIGPRRYMR